MLKYHTRLFEFMHHVTFETLIHNLKYYGCNTVTVDFCVFSRGTCADRDTDELHN